MAFTDAMLNTGDVNPHTVTEVGKALDEHNIRLTGVGVGRDFRDDVLDMLTEKGKGLTISMEDAIIGAQLSIQHEWLQRVGGSRARVVCARAAGSVLHR